MLWCPNNVSEHLPFMTSRIPSYCLKAGPTLCTYLYSQAKFRHVSVAATTVIREGNTTDRKTGIYLVTHISLYLSPLQHSCHTAHVCTKLIGQSIRTLNFVSWKSYPSLSRVTVLSPALQLVY